MERRGPALRARPRPTSATSLAPGLHSVPVPGGDPALVRVPARPSGALVVVLHGAGGRAEGALPILAAPAEAVGALLLAPSSVAPTWDLLVGGWGDDVERLDAALDTVFDRAAIGAGRVGVSGFSDGASYALSLALANAELFTGVAAFSPGFAVADALSGRPGVFVSHGAHDRVLPIDRCSRPLVARLRAAGYAVEYHEFDGGHSVPEEIADQGMGWLAAGWGEDG